jgi:hypothetical protein
LCLNRLCPWMVRGSQLLVDQTRAVAVGEHSCIDLCCCCSANANTHTPCIRAAAGSSQACVLPSVMWGLLLRRRGVCCCGRCSYENELQGALQVQQSPCFQAVPFASLQGFAVMRAGSFVRPCCRFWGAVTKRSITSPYPIKFIELQACCTSGGLLLQALRALFCIIVISPAGAVEAWRVFHCCHMGSCSCWQSHARHASSTCM